MTMGLAKKGMRTKKLMDKPQRRQEDKSGKRFGRLKVIRWGGFKQFKRQRRTVWECLCDCRKTVFIQTGNLLIQKSCGCFAQKRNMTHGESKTIFYRKWLALKTNFKRHGVENPWKGYMDFRAFAYKEYLEKKNEHPSQNLHIIRVRKDKPLARENFAWGSTEDRNPFLTNGTMTRRPFVFEGESKSMTDWGREVGLCRERVRQLVNQGRFDERIKTFRLSNS